MIIKDHQKYFNRWYSPKTLWFEKSLKILDLLIFAEDGVLRKDHWKHLNCWYSPKTVWYEKDHGKYWNCWYPPDTVWFVWESQTSPNPTILQAASLLHAREIFQNILKPLSCLEVQKQNKIWKYNKHWEANTLLCIWQCLEFISTTGALVVITVLGLSSPSITHPTFCSEAYQPLTTAF